LWRAAILRPPFTSPCTCDAEWEERMAAVVLLNELR